MPDANASGKHVLLMLPLTQFRDEEVFETKAILEKAGVRVTLGASRARTCHGMGGGSLDAEIGLPDVKSEDYDALVLAGGSSVPALFWGDKALLALVSEVAQAGKPVAAISLSTVVLARAKLLEGKRATVYYLPEALDELRNAGATYVSEPVVIEGSVITAAGPASVAAFAAAVVSALSGRPVEASSA
jgi:protease I